MTRELVKVAAVLTLGALAPPAIGVSFSPKAIIQSGAAPATEKLAAREIQRYVYLITGTHVRITDDPPPG